MATPRDSSDNFSSFPIATAYQTPAEFWTRSDKADRMLELLQHARDAGLCPVSIAKQLRRFAAWCARSVCHLNTAESCEVALETAERFLAGEATLEQLDQSWSESHRTTAPAGSVGLVHRCTNAAAAIACAHSANPDPFAAARWAAYYAATAQVWHRVKVPKEFCDRPVVFDLHRACEIRKTDLQVSPDLYSAAEHQVRSEIEAAQAEELRRLLPNPFGELTWARLIVATDADQHSDRGDFKERSEKETVSRHMTWGRGWTAEPGDQIVYGCVNDGLVFIPMTQAERLARIYAAMESARTWGEFRRMLPDGVYSEIIEIMTENGRGFDEFYSYWLDDHLDGTRDEAFREYQGLPFHERLPDERDPFDSADIPGLCDGDWPDWPAQEMLNWVPTVIQKTYGQRLDSMLNGPLLTFRTEDEKAIVEAFVELGYRCRRDDRFVRRACGYNG